MKQLFDISIMLPFGILLIQSLILLAICMYALRKMQLISLPLGGMEYSQAIFTAACLISLFIIFTSAISPTFQSSRTFNAQDIPLYTNLLGKSGQFLLVILVIQTLQGGLMFLGAKLFLGTGKFTEELNTGNIPFSIFVAVMTIGFSILLQQMCKEVIEYITPHYLNFR